MVLIRIIFGGKDAQQLGPLKAALNDAKFRDLPIVTEILFNEDIKKTEMDEAQIAEWCKKCDIYIIATHAHQSLKFINAPKVNIITIFCKFNKLHVFVLYYQTVAAFRVT